MTVEQFVAVLGALAILIGAVTRLLFQVEAMLEAQREQGKAMNGLQDKLVTAAEAKGHAEGVIEGQSGHEST